MSEGQEGGGNKWLIVVLFVLGIVITGLAAGIIAIVNNSTNKLKIETCEEAVGYLYEKANMSDMEAFISVSNEILSVVADEEVRVCVYSERFGALYNYGIMGDEKYVSQMLSDAYTIEEISQDARSAYNIYMAETMAGNVDKADEWLDMAEKRGIEKIPGSG